MNEEQPPRLDSRHWTLDFPFSLIMSFRFEDMQVWQRSAAITSQLFKVADTLDQRKYYRFAEQLRAATLSISNNIAEGSGSDSKP